MPAAKPLALIAALAFVSACEARFGKEADKDESPAKQAAEQAAETKAKAAISASGLAAGITLSP